MEGKKYSASWLFTPVSPHVSRMPDDRPFEDPPARDDPAVGDSLGGDPKQKAAEPSKFGKFFGTLRQQIRFMLKVWIPFLANPHERNCLVRYGVRDARVGLEWQIDWPEQCWECGEVENLRRRHFSLEVRAYEKAVVIIGVTLATTLAFGLLTCVTGVGIALMLMTITMMVGAGIIITKSWNENVELGVFTCKEHAKRARPLMTIDDESLYILAPSSQIADAASADVADRRRRKERPIDRRSSTARSGGSSPSERPATGSQQALPPPPDEPIPFDVEGDHVVDVTPNPTSTPSARESYETEKIPFDDDEGAAPPAAKPFSGSIPASSGNPPAASDSRLASGDLPPIPFDDDDNADAPTGGPDESAPESESGDPPRRSLIQPLPESVSDPSMHPPVSRSEDDDPDSPTKKKSDDEDPDDLLLG